MHKENENPAGHTLCLHTTRQVEYRVLCDQAAVSELLTGPDSTWLIAHQFLVAVQNIARCLILSER